MIKGATIIMMFYLFGATLSYLIGGVIPGSVCGMLLLFVALLLNLVKGDDVKDIVQMLTGNMSLFFIPVSVGIVAAFDLVSANWLVFLIVPVATTVLVIVVVGLLQQYLERLGKKKL
ncbi:MAG: CidA/LrgA family protein [Rikenellaceae bacterium]